MIARLYCSNVKKQQRPPENLFCACYVQADLASKVASELGFIVPISICFGGEIQNEANETMPLTFPKETMG